MGNMASSINKNPDPAIKGTRNNNISLLIVDEIKCNKPNQKEELRETK